MLSLRSMHLGLILVAILGADIFGVWSVWRYAQSGDSGMLALGVACIVGGAGLVLYAVHQVRSFDRDGIR